MSDKTIDRLTERAGDNDLLARNAHIPSAEIALDILETEAEISRMEREAEHLEKTPSTLDSARMDHIRASARRSGIKERQQFIADLKHILELRVAKGR